MAEGRIHTIGFLVSVGRRLFTGPFMLELYIFPKDFLLRQYRKHGAATLKSS